MWYNKYIISLFTRAPQAMTDLVLLSQTTVLLIICDLQTSEYSLHSALIRSPFWIEAVFYKCSEFPHFLCCITQKWN